MVKVPILHNVVDKKDLIKKYFIALIPLIFFSFYKNGILLYNNDLIKFSKIFIPLYFYVVSIIIGFIFAKILQEDPGENILLCLITSCTISLNTNVIIYPIILFVSLFIGKVIIAKSKISFNLLSFVRIILILCLLLNAYSYLNIAEKLAKFNYNYFDIFLGHGVGGLATTSTFLLIISFIILLTNPYYKKRIAICASLSYVVIGLLIVVLTKNNVSFLLNGHNYFSFIFLAPFLYWTPTTKNKMLIYGTLVGVLTAIFSLIVPYEASFISILLLSFLCNISKFKF